MYRESISSYYPRKFSTLTSLATIELLFLGLSDHIPILFEDTGFSLLLSKNQVAKKQVSSGKMGIYLIHETYIPMKSESIRVVLVATSHPGNIGSTARAMKTMGLQRLYLVSPRSFPDRWANELAAGADDVLQQAIVSDTLMAALQGCQLILATSARPRDMDLPGLIPSTAAELISQQPDDTEIAIVFGREHAGLTNDELLHCHYHIHIPSHPEFSSLNLAQAVQIIAYELRVRSLSPNVKTEMRPTQLAHVEAVEQFYDHLREVLIEIHFLKPSNPKKLLQRLRRLFNRTKLEATEVNILRGILTSIQRALHEDRSHR
jgi:tRNA (cytidine32/uridine32-2'-O)-methyltransferase